MGLMALVAVSGCGSACTLGDSETLTGAVVLRRYHFLLLWQNQLKMRLPTIKPATTANNSSIEKDMVKNMMA